MMRGLNIRMHTGLSFPVGNLKDISNLCLTYSALTSYKRKVAAFYRYFFIVWVKDNKFLVATQEHTLAHHLRSH